MPSALHLVSGLPRFRHLRLVPLEQTGIRPSVVAHWTSVNRPLEGVLPFMYTDALNLVTTGMGDLIDASQSGSSAPWAPALSLPWRNPDGSLADAGTIIAQWQTVKNGGVNSSVNAGPLTSIRLDDAGIQQTVARTIASNEAILRGYFANWDTMPADAQAAIMSMAWAMGAGFPATFVEFTKAINAGRYADAADLSDFQGVGVQQRIDMDKAMLANAQAVVDGGYDPGKLYWPGIPSGWMPSWLLKAGAVLGGMAVVLGGAYVATQTDALSVLKRAI